MAKRAEDVRGGGQTQKADTSFLPDILIGLSTIPSRLRPSSIFHHPSTNSAPPPDPLPLPSVSLINGSVFFLFSFVVIFFRLFFFPSLFPRTLWMRHSEEACEADWEGRRCESDRTERRMALEWQWQTGNSSPTPFGSRAAGGAILPASLIIEESGGMRGFHKRIINGPPLLKELITLRGSFVYAVSHLSRLLENEVAASP